MSSVNQVTSFRGNEQGSDNSLLYGIGAGALTGVGVKYFGNKIGLGHEITQDEFVKSVKDEEKFKYTTEPSTDELAKMTAAENELRTTTPTSTSTTPTVVVDGEPTELEKATKNLENKTTTYKQEVEKLNLEKKLNTEYTLNYNNLETVRIDKEVTLDQKEMNELKTQKTILEKSIKEDKAKLEGFEQTKSNPTGQETLRTQIAKNEAKIKGINEKILTPDEIKKENIKKAITDIDEKVKTTGEKETSDLKALSDAKTENKGLDTKLSALNDAEKDKDAINKLKKEIAESDLKVKNLTHQSKLSKTEAEFHKSVQTALKESDAESRSAELKKILINQEKKIATEGSAMKKVTTAKTDAMNAFNIVEGLKENGGKTLALESKFSKYLGETEKSISSETKTITEGTKDVVKDLPKVVKEAFEAVKGKIAKVNPGPGKAALFGLGAAAVVFILAKIAGGSSEPTEQA